MRAFGLGAVRSDFRHYCRIHGARTPLQKLALPLVAPSLIALAVYRYGSWVYYTGRHSLPHRALYFVLAETARRLTKVLIPMWAEVDDEVWLASHAPMLIGGHLGRGVSVHAGVTLGARIGGSRAPRGVPTVGAGAVIGPGASISGPIVIPSGAVVGPNTVVAHGLLPGPAWLGIPPLPFRGEPGALVPDLLAGAPR